MSLRSRWRSHRHNRAVRREWEIDSQRNAQHNPLPAGWTRERLDAENERLRDHLHARESQTERWVNYDDGTVGLYLPTMGAVIRLDGVDDR